MFIDKRSNGSYYDVLMVAPNASDADIREAFERLSMVYHPDKTTMNKRIAALRFRLVNEAYAALRSSEGRARYNKLLLMRDGKPRGLKLAGDNDNYNPKEKKIRDMLYGLMKPRVNPDDAEQPNIAEQAIEIPDTPLEENGKDRDHG